MCGIVGYIGSRDAKEVILSGLEKLEYRGYDSAGIAVLNDGSIVQKKTKGHLKNLSEKIRERDLLGNIGIGHTRWATHGEPSDINSHPHSSKNGKISIVHNGIIENYQELKKELQGKGYIFKSETDTEVIAHLLEDLYCGDLFTSIIELMKRIRGSYALGILHEDNPDELYCIREDSPIVVGIGQGENFIASDVPAILNYTNKVIFIENGEIAKLTRDKVEVFNRNKEKLSKKVTEVTWTLDEATKAGYPHFMLKEIYEQPEGIRKTLSERMDNKGYFDFSDLGLERDTFQKISKLYIVACGTAYHAGLQGKHALSRLAKVQSIVEVASEFRYNKPLIDENTLVILLSQSGETSDTLAALREAKKQGGKTLAITNVLGSSITREADYVIYTKAGPEIAVASTKAYTTQVAVMYMLAMYWSLEKGSITNNQYQELKEELLQIPEKISEVLEGTPSQLERAANKLKNVTSGFFIGRGLDYYIGVEASLKVKEVSYIHTEALASGELKHGTIALIENDVPVIAIATQDDLIEKSISNIKEVKARGAFVLGVTIEGHHGVEDVVDEIIYIPKTHQMLTGFLSIIPMQLFAYYLSLAKGLDVDKPRNLAKSVTVE